MPNPYDIINGYYGSPKYATEIAKVSELQRKAMLGWQIINENPIPTTPQEVFDKLVRKLREVGKWRGSKSAAQNLLGSIDYEGECGLFAYAFRTLLTAPKPFGLGLDKGQVSLVTWKGLYGNGFVVKHPEVIMELEANVDRDPSVSLVDSPLLHFWDNHKVINYAGRLWDPSYGCTYGSDREVILFDVFKDEVEIDGATWYACEPTNLANSIKVEGKNLSPSQGVFFKQTKVLEKVRYQGPLLRHS